MASSMAAWILRLAQASPIRYRLNRPSGFGSRVCGRALARCSRSTSPKLVESGFNRLVPPNDSALVAEGLMDAMETMARPDPAVGIYGEGHAGKQIVETLIRFTPAICPAADGAVPSN